MTSTTSATMTSSKTSTANVPLPATPAVAKFTDLENDAIKVTFTSIGRGDHGNRAEAAQGRQRRQRGAERAVALQYPRARGMAGRRTASFESKQIPDGVSFSTTLPNGLKWERTYTFGKNLESDTGMSGSLRVLSRKIARYFGPIGGEAADLYARCQRYADQHRRGGLDAARPIRSASVARCRSTIPPPNGRSNPRSRV